ncbi:TPA: ATP-binding cassette domain-containing protein [Candidatus Bathyarchaeota archaeon]|nr:ATP-binding cassette domain-containing protein [Candidatus Bathyarchaeota archaeon]
MIKLEEVSYIYPNGVKALKEASLTIGERASLAIMGKSGAGKTTLIKHLNGLLKPTSGRVTVDGVDTTKATVAQLSRKVGIVFQNPDHQLFAETVEEEIAFPLKNFGFSGDEIKARTEWVLELFNLNRYRHHSPLSLSGGEKKRVAMASIIAWKPKYLVLDEPTLGQDRGNKLRLKELFEEFREEGRTVVMVTHDIEFVAECGFDVALLVDGKVSALGSAKEILSNLNLLKEASLIAPQLAELFLELKSIDVAQPVFTVEEAERLILECLLGGVEKL